VCINYLFLKIILHNFAPNLVEIYIQTLLKHKTISQAISVLFLLLVLNASFLAVFYPKNNLLDKQNQQNTQTEQPSDETKDSAKLSETVPFDALIQVALQCEFHKIVFEVPQNIVIYRIVFKEKIETQAFWSVALLSYFQNIFSSAILINAP
jgi:hypothetical protein